MSEDRHPANAHADPVAVGLRSTPGIYHVLCRTREARAVIGSDPRLAAREPHAGVPRDALALREPPASYAETRDRKGGSA